jgi:xanthine dehydrogenase accessory factor
MTNDNPVHLYVIGAGPVGQQVAQWATQLAFRVTVIDERESLMTPERFPAGTELICGDFDRLLPSLPTTPGDFVAIVSQVWQRDARALEILVQRPLAYLGMIGCQRKIGEIFPQLQERDVPGEMLSRVKAPIGLNIGSKTPAEIAVSICAELIAARREMRRAAE